MIWFVFFACLVLSFTFAGIESGVLSVNRVRLRHYARRGEEAAQNLDRLLTRIERLMVTVVLITSAANVFAITVLYMECTRWLGQLGAIVALAVALPIFAFGLEFLPKSIFRRFPYRTLVIFARILTVVDLLLAPLVNLLALAVKPFFQRNREVVSGRIVSIEELKRALGQDGERATAERAIIEHVVDFRSLRAGDLMIPLDKVPQVKPEMTVEDVRRQASLTGEGRFLVVESDESVSGFLRVIDLLLDDVRSGRVQSYMRRVVTVASGERAMEALTKMRAARLPLAIVLGEEHRPVGVLTSEHLVRRLLGGA